MLGLLDVERDVVPVHRRGAQVGGAERDEVVVAQEDDRADDQPHQDEGGGQHHPASPHRTSVRNDA